MKIQKLHFKMILAGLVSTLVTTQAVGMGGCMMGCTSTTIIDPPRGAIFTDPVTMTNISTTPGIVEVNLEAKVAPINVNGITANLMTYTALIRRRPSR